MNSSFLTEAKFIAGKFLNFGVPVVASRCAQLAPVGHFLSRFAKRMCDMRTAP